MWDRSRLENTTTSKETNMSTPFNTTVQFPTKQDYKKLKMLSVLSSLSVGEQIQEMVNNQLSTFTHTELRKALKNHPELIPVVS